ncbi:hypothetical protein ERJ75_001448000 [Trypanosoma vivax]|nr:hypothetical protein ERJ75_001448000 [Trypanosoma vivax]
MAVIDVVGGLPSDTVPCRERIPRLLRFDTQGSVLGPVKRGVALDHDWFASNVVGGEAQIRPEVDHINVAQIALTPAVVGSWKSVMSGDGIFNEAVPQGSVQFYAVALYSEVAQDIMLQCECNTSAVLYLGGSRITSDTGEVCNASLVVSVTKGYHQLLVKLFSGYLANSGLGAEVVNSLLSLRITGTAVGYAQSVVSSVPEVTYTLSPNMTFSSLLHLGRTAQDFVYGTLDEDFIDVRHASPRPGNADRGGVWTALFFPDGRVPVHSRSLPEGKEAAVSYVAFSVHSGYENAIPVRWTFATEGKADIFVDGACIYSRDASHIAGTTMSLFSCRRVGTSLWRVSQL